MDSLCKLGNAVLRLAMAVVEEKKPVKKTPMTLAGRCSRAAATAWQLLWQPPASRIEVLGLVAVLLLCSVCLSCLLK